MTEQLVHPEIKDRLNREPQGVCGSGVCGEQREHEKWFSMNHLRKRGTGSEVKCCPEVNEDES